MPKQTTLADLTQETAIPPDPNWRRVLATSQVRSLRRRDLSPRDRAMMELLAQVRLPLTNLCSLRPGNLRRQDAQTHLVWQDGLGRPRYAVLGQHAQTALQAWLQVRPSTAGEWLFTGCRPGKPLNPADLAGLIRHWTTAARTAAQSAPSNLHSPTSPAPRLTPLQPGEPGHLELRQTELHRLRGYVARGVHVLLVGPLGAGKSHLLARLEGERLVRLPALAPPRDNVISLAEQLHQRGLPLGGADFTAFRRSQSRLSPLGWAQLILEALPPEQWTLVIDDLADLTLAGARVLDRLAQGLAIAAATERVHPSHQRFFSRFERLPVANLPDPAARQLIRQALSGARVEDLRLAETHLLQHTAGNPRAILDSVARLRREPSITRRAVRRLGPSSGRPQIDVTAPVLLLPLLAFGAMRYLSYGLESLDLYILAGVGLVAGVWGRSLFSSIIRSVRGPAA